LIKIYISGVYWSSTLYNTQNCSLLKKKKWRWIRKSRSLCKSNIYMLSPFPVRFAHCLWKLKPQDIISTLLGPERPEETEIEKSVKNSIFGWAKLGRGGHLYYHFSQTVYVIFWNFIQSETVRNCGWSKAHWVINFYNENYTKLAKNVK